MSRLIDAIDNAPTIGVDCTDFIRWIRDEVMRDNGDYWELNAEALGEVICRKLKKIGALELEDGYYWLPLDPVGHGKWGEQWTTRGESMKEIELLFGKCSNCGQWHVALQVTFPYFSKYCPHCGAKMEEERNE